MDDNTATHRAALAGVRRDPARSLAGCERIVIVGRTGSGKTTLARELAGALQVPHVELDSLFFGPGLSTVPVDVLRDRTRVAISGTRWVTDGNKSAVRDLVWPRADTIVWLDYPLFVSLWRLAGRARNRTATLRSESAASGSGKSVPKQMVAAGKGVLTALKSHTGQRREYPKMFAKEENRHLAVARLRSPRATKRWMEAVLGSGAPSRPSAS